jgi:hypothetical protein
MSLFPRIYLRNMQYTEELFENDLSLVGGVVISGYLTMLSVFQTIYCIHIARIRKIRS